MGTGRTEVPPVNHRKEIRVYTDVSTIPTDETVSWCWLALLPNGEILGPRTGRSQTPKKDRTHAEAIPKEKARNSLKNQGLPIVILTDHPNRTKPDEIVCDKRDPWHLVCQYASANTRLRGIIRNHKQMEKKPRK